MKTELTRLQEDLNLVTFEKTEMAAQVDHFKMANERLTDELSSLKIA